MPLEQQRGEKEKKSLSVGLICLYTGGKSLNGSPTVASRAKDYRELHDQVEVRPFYRGSIGSWADLKYLPSRAQRCLHHWKRSFRLSKMTCPRFRVT